MICHTSCHDQCWDNHISSRDSRPRGPNMHHLMPSKHNNRMITSPHPQAANTLHALECVCRQLLYGPQLCLHLPSVAGWHCLQAPSSSIHSECLAICNAGQTQVAGDAANNSQHAWLTAAPSAHISIALPQLTLHATISGSTQNVSQLDYKFGV